MKQHAFAASAVAFHTGVSRGKLNRFLGGTAALKIAEVERLLEFLDLGKTAEDIEKKHRRNYIVNTAQFEAVSQNLVSHSLAYIADGENASGTFVAIGGREFIATAAHTISPSRPSLKLIGDGIHPVERNDIKIVAAGRARGANPDVGYIEIAAGTASQLGRSPIELDRICDSGPGQAGRIAFLYGNPFALVERFVNHKAKQRIIGIHSFTYPNATLAYDEWPTVPRDAEAPRKSVDLFIPYDVTEDMIVDRGHGTRLPNPRGASGGGIWQGIGPINDGLWHAEKIKLIAIQSNWDEERKYIRGVQIKHWLRLVEEDYPDLRKELGKVQGSKSA